MLTTHPILTVLGASMGIYFAFIFALSLRSTGNFEMDAGVRYSFHAVFVIYRDIYKLIFVSGIALSLFSQFDLLSKIVLSLSSVYALFFILWLNFSYEYYQHVRYRSKNPISPYTPWKYAATLTLGGMSIILFAAGVLRRLL